MDRGQSRIEHSWQVPLVRVYRFLNPDVKRLGSAHASGVPMLGSTVRVGSEADETSIYTMSSQNLTLLSENAKKRRAEDILTLSDDETTFPSYLVISAIDEQPINLSIFGIQKLLSCAVGDIKSAKKLRNGSVLVEVRNKNQADLALKLTNWVSQPVKVNAHRSLNTSRGIIRCREFRDCNGTEVLNALSSQGVTCAKRLMSKRNNKQIGRAHV